MTVRWQPDPSLPTGGYFFEQTTGQPVGGVGTPLPANATFNAATNTFGEAQPAAAAGAKVQTRWQPDPSLPSGGYFFDYTTGQPVGGVGTPLAPNAAFDPKTGTFAKPPAAPAPNMNDPLLQQWIAKHGALQGGAYVTNAKIKNPSGGAAGEDTMIDNPDPTSRYTFADGSTLEVTSKGGVVKATEAKPTKASDSGKVVGGVLYEPDPDNPTGPWLPKTEREPPKPGDVATTEGRNLDNQLKAKQIAQRQANEMAGKGYLTDQELREYTDAAQKAGLNAESTAAQISRLANQNKNDDIKAQNDILTTNASVGLTSATTGRVGAETSKIGAETDLTRANIQALAAKNPADVAYTQAQTAKTLADMNAPKDVAGDVTAPKIVQRNPLTGALSFQDNPNFQPKDTASQIVQLQQQAQAKRDELNAQVMAGKATGEQASQLFNSWWDQNVEPRRAGIQQAQDQSRFENQVKASAEQRQAYTAAQGAGTEAINAYQAQAKNRVGPGYAAAMQQVLDSYSSGNLPGKIDTKGLVWQAPDLTKVAQEATLGALKNISPFAAAQAGNPGGGGLQVPTGMDLQSALNRTQYNGFTGGPVGVPQPQPQPAAVGGPPIVPWAQTAPAAPPMVAGATPFMNSGTTYYGDGGLQQEPFEPYVFGG